MNQINFLGGADEIGANSIYLELNGINIVIDCGIHPKLKDRENLFPNYKTIEDKIIKYLFITHAHTDHIGALPYFIKYFPKSRVLSTYETRDLAELILKDSSKHIIRENSFSIEEEILNQYKPDILSNIWKLIEPIKINEEFLLKNNTEYNDLIDNNKISFGFNDKNINQNTKTKLFWSGHILGSVGIYFEYIENKITKKSKNILFTGDMNLGNQFLVNKASFPKQHIDTLVLESTNCGTENKIKTNENIKLFTKFINTIVNDNGSVLIPAFALGKTQEILRLLNNLMINGNIPCLPIYTSGLGNKISKIYDRYCYADYMINKGFEVSDIKQNHIDYNDLNSGNFFKEPSIVLASNGMLAKGTLSYNLTKEWLKRKNYGIAFVGYQQEKMPGYEVLNSEINKFIKFENTKIKRFCKIEKFRFSAHSSLEQTVNFIKEINPNKIFIHHGDEDACNNLALEIFKTQIDTKIIIPLKNKFYEI